MEIQRETSVVLFNDDLGGLLNGLCTNTTLQKITKKTRISWFQFGNTKIYNQNTWLKIFHSFFFKSPKISQILHFLFITRHLVLTFHSFLATFELILMKKTLKIWCDFLTILKNLARKGRDDSCVDSRVRQKMATESRSETSMKKQLSQLNKLLKSTSCRIQIFPLKLWRTWTPTSTEKEVKKFHNFNSFIEVDVRWGHWSSRNWLFNYKEKLQIQIFCN